MKEFFKRYLLSTTGALLGRLPVFLIPFALLAAGYSSKLADQLILLLGLAWFFPLVLSNVFVDIFVHALESQKKIIQIRKWIFFVAGGALVPALISYGLMQGHQLGEALAVFLSVYVSSFFGLVSTRSLALKIVAQSELVAGLSNGTRIIVLIVLMASPDNAIEWSLAGAALAELLRFFWLSNENLQPFSSDQQLPAGSLRLVGGALLVAGAQYAQRWIIFHAEHGHVLWYEIADKIYSLVALGLTLGLSGVLQRHITGQMHSAGKDVDHSSIRLGLLLGCVGAALCMLLVFVLRLFGQDILLLRGVDIGLVESLVVVMAIGFIPAAMTMVISRVFVAKSRNVEILGLSLVSALVTVGGSYFTALAWGVVGVAVITVLNNFIVFFLYLKRYLVRRG